ncbi:hypothetical protein GJ699_00415 [Duganella sp. FT80W]|uniref:Uncharacterized protein n=1 Tax=Duganella guangzhouensis TaxID=2666084 RepID=A0A6I2KTT3_9BURK|nr:hypothetical protein [Duganella guangzhouensis]MRW88447.1 hypothetical protein [Duganella guangzhouensis]
MVLMDGNNTPLNETLQTLLVRTAVMQSSIEGIVDAVEVLRLGQLDLQKQLQEVRDAQAATQASIGILQNDVNWVKETYATKAQVESIRSELYRALEKQTWRLFAGSSAVCSALVYATYYIARYVH